MKTKFTNYQGHKYTLDDKTVTVANSNAIQEIQAAIQRTEIMREQCIKIQEWCKAYGWECHREGLESALRYVLLS